MSARASLVLLLGLSLTACGAFPFGARGVTTVSPWQAAARRAPLLSGRVVPPGLRLQATEASDILLDAIVSLSERDGKVRAAGLTAPDGSFALFRSADGFTPAPATDYLLEAYNRLPGSLRWAGLRTVVRRSDDGQRWRSVSGDPIVLSVETTALAQLYEEDPLLGFAGVEDRFAGGVLSAPPGYDPAVVAARAADTGVRLRDGADPAGQNVYRGQVSITSDADCAAYRDYDAIEGNLIVSGPGVTALDLPRLKRLNGFFLLDGCSNLTSLQGLGNLRSILYAQFHAAGLTSLAGLEKLEFTYGFQLDALPALASLHGPTALRAFTQLMIHDCPSLRSLAGLEQAKLSDMLIIENAPILESVTGVGFASEPTLVGISNAPVLRDLSALAGITALRQGLQLANCPALETLAGLEGLREAGALYLQHLPALHDAAPLSALRRLGSLNVDDTGLAGLAPLGGLEGFDGPLRVVNNAALCGFDPAVLWPAFWGALSGTAEVANNGGSCP